MKKIRTIPLSAIQMAQLLCSSYCAVPMKKDKLTLKVKDYVVLHLDEKPTGLSVCAQFKLLLHLSTDESVAIFRITKKSLQKGVR